MKITVRNLGAIKEAEFDLKPLTIMVGPNNSGKSWLAYALESIFSTYGFLKYVEAYIEGKVPQAYPLLEQTIEKIATEVRSIETIDLVQFADEYGEAYFNNVACYAQNWLRSFMSSQLASFDALELSISLDEVKDQFLEHVANYSVRMRIPARKKNPLLRISKKRGSRKLYIYTYDEQVSIDGNSSEEKSVGSIPAELIREHLIPHVFLALHESLYPFVHILPTERTTFVTFPFVSGESKDVEEDDNILKSSRSRRSGRRSIMSPVGHFLTMLSSIFHIGSVEMMQRDEEAKKDPRIKEYIQLAQVLETEVLGGTIDFSLQEPDPRREILFQLSKGISLEISIASSMVKELAPLMLFLRYIAQPGELLIIDEPEMNLHPEAQVKIIEFLAMLVNAGLHVLVTTHSPYIVDHLINLIEAKKRSNPDEIVEMFFLKRQDAFIAQDVVSVNLVDKGEVKNILDGTGNIDWETFSNVTERITRIHFAL